MRLSLINVVPSASSTSKTSRIEWSAACASRTSLQKTGLSGISITRKSSSALAQNCPKLLKYESDFFSAAERDAAAAANGRGKSPFGAVTNSMRNVSDAETGDGA